MKLNSLEELLVDQLRDLHNAEKQLTQALPKLVAAASSPKLHDALEEHLGETEEQLQRLEEMLEELHQGVGRKKCHGMEGLIAEGAEVLKGKSEPSVKDAAIIAAAQRIEHYEIAGYGTARTFAEMLGHGRMVEILQRSLAEEHAADQTLNELAMNEINIEAKAAHV